MRISFEEQLPRPEEIFTVGAALAVVFSGGGGWFDAGAPVDRRALADLIESLDPKELPHRPDPAAARDEAEETLTIVAGTIRWDEQRIELTIDDLDFTAHISAHVRGGLTIADRDESFAVVKVHGHPRRFLYRCGTFFGGPVIRHYVHREARKRSAAFRELVASMAPVPRPVHRSDEWKFVPDRAATRSALFREPGPLLP